MSTNSNDRRDKGRYLDRVKVRRKHIVAGVSVIPGPDRAWAAAPLVSTRCIVDDWRGMQGTVPMHPIEFDARPLEDWLGL